MPIARIVLSFEYEYEEDIRHRLEELEHQGYTVEVDYENYDENN